VSILKKAIFVLLLVLSIILTGCSGNIDSNNSSTPSKDSVPNSDVNSDYTDNNAENINSEDTNSDEDVEDSSDFDDSIWDDIGWDDSGSGNSTESGTITYYKEEFPDYHTTAFLLNSKKGGADKEADTLRKSIENSKDNIKITGQKYYVSNQGNDNADGKTPQTAWKTLDNVTANAFLFTSGDAILLERGGVYRLNSTFLCKSDITYAAYGEGEKPVIYGSVKNYAWGSEWQPSRKQNVWKLNLERNDAGIIVFDHGKAVGVKKTNVNS
jgi:hypothetical protein